MEINYRYLFKYILKSTNVGLKANVTSYWIALKTLFCPQTAVNARHLSASRGPTAVRGGIAPPGAGHQSRVRRGQSSGQKALNLSTGHKGSRRSLCMWFNTSLTEERLYNDPVSNPAETERLNKTNHFCKPRLNLKSEFRSAGIRLGYWKRKIRRWAST